ncbi:DUF924 family protein [Flavimaricola marinus]|uniref:DUF924 domain-containing protein n=1 Tax=Flavimaricola marinus TaxID=1819565 RepID=A0A238LE61_9RHOB|nr:DUF924 family protein [Flavimaricola marinus]SMY07911.1 hypothetical protein LOM8899_02056 [Flavimaricola marinus]
METPDTILRYWLDEVGPEGWYTGSAALDSEVRARFLSTWQEAMCGACGLWLTSASGSLAYIILTDQFSRNMFRGTAQAFASDNNARAAAKIALSRDWDMRINEPARQFFYMPLEHSENLIDQDRAIRLFASRMPETGRSNLLHAKTHRQIIRMFGRFPFRNAALDRANTALEQEWLDAGGYGAAYRALEAEAADA